MGACVGVRVHGCIGKCDKKRGRKRKNNEKYFLLGLKPVSRLLFVRHELVCFRLNLSSGGTTFLPDYGVTFWPHNSA